MVKHGIAVADFHSGHKVGLTPPDWQIKKIFGSFTKRSKWAQIQIDLWDSFKDILSKLPPLDFVFALGDLIEGKGKKSGGTDLITTDTQDQCDMAVETFRHIRMVCKDDVKIIGVYGTDYHTATEGQDWENEVAKSAGFYKIGAHEWPSVNGCVFDLKHKIGSSTIPHGRFTAIAKEQLWNALWSERDEAPKSDVILRAHVHYWSAIANNNGLAMTLPALQGMGSRYGARECIGTVDWGLVHFWVDDNGAVEWEPHIRRIKGQKAQVVVV